MNNICSMAVVAPTPAPAPAAGSCAAGSEGTMGCPCARNAAGQLGCTVAGLKCVNSICSDSSRLVVGARALVASLLVAAAVL